MKNRKALFPELNIGDTIEFVWGGPQYDRKTQSYYAVSQGVTGVITDLLVTNGLNGQSKMLAVQVATAGVSGVFVHLHKIIKHKPLKVRQPGEIVVTPMVDNPSLRIPQTEE